MFCFIIHVYRFILAIKLLISWKKKFINLLKFYIFLGQNEKYVYAFCLKKAIKMFNIFCV